MAFDRTLPEGFNGTFTFTNFSDEEFIGVWAKKEYVFPPNSTTVMVIPEHTPLEVQWIRKKFAKDLAEREYIKTPDWKSNFNREQDPQGAKRLYSIHQAGSYDISALEPLIHRCLEPLPQGTLKVRVQEFVPIEERLSTDDEGELNTVSLGPKDDVVNELRKGRESLKAKAKL